MNLHKAKGLEAPIVFMASPCGDKDHDATEHIDRVSDPAQGYFTITRKEFYQTEIIAQPVGWTALAEKEREFMHAEVDRLLYVAATRARQILVVSQYLSKPEIDPWSGLGVTLSKQLELEEHEVEPNEPEPLHNAPNVEQQLETWQKWLTHAAQPTFQRTSVTEQTRTDSTIVLERPKEGRGMAFGSIVHRCLEAVGNGLPGEELPEYIEMVAVEEGLKRELVAEALQTVQRVENSAIWQRAMGAKQHLHEFAFTISSKADGASEAEGATESILKGVIDLVFEEDDGWVIVDFKTDLFEEYQEGDFKNYYGPQVLAYADIWQRTTGLTLKEQGLYFVEYDRYVAIII
jgi:ATP-dependent helicase/nuclease subunit A